MAYDKSHINNCGAFELTEKQALRKTFDSINGVADPQAATDAITDSTGGTGATTFAAITAPAANATTALTADMTAVKNALSEIATQLNALRTKLIAAGIFE